MCRGASEAGNSGELVVRLERLQHRREELQGEERELEKQLQCMQQCLRNIAEDTNNDQYPFMFSLFVCCLFVCLCVFCTDLFIRMGYR